MFDVIAVPLNIWVSTVWTLHRWVTLCSRWVIQQTAPIQYLAYCVCFFCCSNENVASIVYFNRGNVTLGNVPGTGAHNKLSSSKFLGISVQGGKVHEVNPMWSTSELYHPWNKARPQHREFHPLLFPIRVIIRVTICRCHYKGSTFSSVI